MIGLGIAAIAIVKNLAVVGKIFQIQYLAALSFVADVPGMDLRTVGPTRLLYFASLLFLLMGLMPRTESLRRMTWPRPVIACGQKSLEIFCLITVLSELAALLLFEIDGNQLSFIVVAAFGTLITLATGMVLTNSGFVSRVLRLNDLLRLAPRNRL